MLAHLPQVSHQAAQNLIFARLVREAQQVGTQVGGDIRPAEGHRPARVEQNPVIGQPAHASAQARHLLLHARQPRAQGLLQACYSDSDEQLQRAR